MRFCIDPGSSKSGFVVHNPEDNSVPTFGKVPNEEILDAISGDSADAFDISECDTVAIEHPQPRGQLASWQLMKTLRWIGRYQQAILTDRDDLALHFVDRKDIKMALCGSPSVKDKNIRQAVIDLYGGQDKAIGGVKCPACKGKGWRGRGRPVCSECNGKKWEIPPGPLKNMSNDAWQALAIAVAFDELRDQKKFIDDTEKADA